MDWSDISSVALLLVAAVGAGLINTVVGSGSLLTFPVMVMLGMPPVAANVANTVGLSVGNTLGAYGYRAELRGLWRIVAPLAVVTVVGALGGAALLLVLPKEVFSVAAPALVLVGAALVLCQPWLRPPAGEAEVIYKSRARARVAWSATLITGGYGGYFGAAQGVIIVGVLGAVMDLELQRINAIKNVLQSLAGWAATFFFVFRMELDWMAIALVAAGSLFGAYLGARFGRRIPAIALRLFVVLVGVGSAIVLFLM